MLASILQISKQLISLKNPDIALDLALSFVKSFTIERFTHKGIKSALIYSSKKRPKRFKILLNAHLDVIPGKVTQYAPRVKGNKLYGVGSMDMKSNAACLILAFAELANKLGYPLALQLTTDEEDGGFDGTKFQIDKGVRADFVIAGEPTNFDIVNMAKGVLWVKISTRGKTAHSAYPWRGENAILKMNKYLDLLKERYPIPKQEAWKTTINLAKIETSNQIFNKIPDECTAWLDIRFIPDNKDILKHMRNIFPKDCNFEIIENEVPLFTDPRMGQIVKLRKIARQVSGQDVFIRGANGTSDARHFAEVSCPGIEFGPIGGGIGSDEEWVDIPSLEKYYKILSTFLQSQR